MSHIRKTRLAIFTCIFQTKYYCETYYIKLYRKIKSQNIATFNLKKMCSYKESLEQVILQKTNESRVK